MKPTEIKIKKGNEYIMSFYEEGDRRGETLCLRADNDITFKSDDKNIKADDDGSQPIYKYFYKEPYPLFKGKKVHHIMWQESK